MFIFLTVLQALVAAALVGIILIQRSEGGGLAGGGSPAGLMSARGAGDFLTRTTTILAFFFVTLSIALAMLAAGANAPGSVDEGFDRDTSPAAAIDALNPTGDGADAPADGEAAPADAPAGDDAEDPLAPAESQ